MRVALGLRGAMCLSGRGLGGLVGAESVSVD